MRISVSYHEDTPSTVPSIAINLHVNLVIKYRRGEEKSLQQCATATRLKHTDSEFSAFRVMVIRDIQWSDVDETVLPRATFTITKPSLDDQFYYKSLEPLQLSPSATGCTYPQIKWDTLLGDTNWPVEWERMTLLGDGQLWFPPLVLGPNLGGNVILGYLERCENSLVLRLVYHFETPASVPFVPARIRLEVQVSEKNSPKMKKFKESVCTILKHAPHPDALYSALLLNDINWENIDERVCPRATISINEGYDYLFVFDNLTQEGTENCLNYASKFVN
jgi:hypothetical protein